MADEEEREECLHYIHSWHKNLSREDVVMPIGQMEKYVMSTFAAKLRSLTDPENPEAGPFYHDFMEEDGPDRVKYATVRTFMSRTRLSLRRVLGCGHFILSTVCIAYNKLERQHGTSWRDYDLWQTMKADLLEKDLLNPHAPCDFEATYQWFQSFYSELASRLPAGDEAQNALIPFTMLFVRGPCDRNVDEQSEEFMFNYQEFLAFHLHNMHELGLLSGEPQMTQYRKLMRRRDYPPPAKLPRSQANYMRVVNTTTTIKEMVYNRTVKVTMRQLAIMSGAGQTRTLRSVGYSSSTHAKQNNTTVSRQGGTTTSSWQRSSYHEAQWQQFTREVSAKVIRQEWRVGCAGCPRGIQWKVTKSGRKRSCKWVTVKRVVLVRRMVNKEIKKPSRRRPAAIRQR